MTLVWIAVGFLFGCLAWHWLGGYLLRKLGFTNRLRTDVIRGLNTDTLVALRRDTLTEIQRRRKLIDDITNGPTKENP